MEMITTPIREEKMMAKPKNLIFEGVSDADLIRLFLESRQLKQEEEQSWARNNENRPTAELIIGERRY